MKYKINYSIFIPLILFIAISILTIWISEKLLMENNYYFIKQAIWYLIGFIFVYLIYKIGNDFIYKYSIFFYIIGNIMLLILLICASPINEAKCWFTIKGIGTIQPSEFMKIIIILILALQCTKFKKDFKNPSILDEFKFLIKIFFILIIPSILTFLEPDTGVVLIYFLITIIMLFVSGIRIRWFVLLFFICFILISMILIIYFFNQNLFINLFGNSFFLRINRLLDWSNQNDGFQLKNSLISIGSAGIFGHGFNLNLYIPEPQTDFIFSVFASSFGFLGVFLLILLIGYFDVSIINLGIKTKKIVDKFVIAGIMGMLIYQQFQNISMTFGLMPITGITLPFISYGGSSLISYMIMIGLIFNINNN